ncbi:GNAT family N-acetyltransferase [Rossellomorea aquimaris]|uniref:GNAT family N-acetyltransferase n=1 Tax=Rossellomorea aquimaris TaxID=189382 RepID=UPI0009ECC78C|nr:GNAT family N-acetyltransferase [Rossellomorea aquimaris]
MKLVQEAKEDRSKFFPLLNLADESKEMISKYIHSGTLHTVWTKEKRIGIILLIEKDAQTIEIKNLGILEEFRGKGMGKRALELITDYLKGKEYKKMIVGTANSSIGNLIFYQKCGFRMNAVEKDFFLSYPHPIIENGLRAYDMVMLEKKIDK